MALRGKNFSGRTAQLRLWTGLSPYVGGELLPSDSPGSAHGAYIGPEVYNCLSGLATTVFDELALHAGTRELGRHRIWHLVQAFRLDKLFDRSPFTLSGGEQALLAVVSAIALNPGRLAIDSALEQVDTNSKSHLVDWLRTERGSKLETRIADNRLSEFESSLDIKDVTTADVAPLDGRLTFGPIDPLKYSKVTPTASNLILDNVRFRYPNGPDILRQVSMEFQAGRLYMLEGANGAGKSTLAKLLTGVLRPTGGTIRAQPGNGDPWQRPGQIATYHSQNPDLQLFSTTVAEEVRSGIAARGLASDELSKRISNVLDTCGLSAVGEEHPLDLPFVIRKRVALASTIVTAAPWLILDEPTLGQDDQTSSALAFLINRFVADGMGVIVISHSSWFRKQLSATPLRLRDGILSLAP
jgi:energy-coupling factor transport system ATP-binding protein